MAGTGIHCQFWEQIPACFCSLGIHLLALTKPLSSGTKVTPALLFSLKEYPCFLELCYLSPQSSYNSNSTQGHLESISDTAVVPGSTVPQIPLFCNLLGWSTTGCLQFPAVLGTLEAAQFLLRQSADFKVLLFAFYLLPSARRAKHSLKEPWESPRMMPTSSCRSAFPSECCCTKCSHGRAPSPSAPRGLVPAVESSQHHSLTPSSSTVSTSARSGQGDTFPVPQQVLACPEAAPTMQVWKGWNENAGMDRDSHGQG